MTPLLNPRNEAEVRYNDAQKRTRIVMERCSEILSRRFPCLHAEWRTRYGNSLVIIVAVVVPPEREVESTTATRVEMKQQIWWRVVLTDTRRRFATLLKIEDTFTIVSQFDGYFTNVALCASYLWK